MNCVLGADGEPSPTGAAKIMFIHSVIAPIPIRVHTVVVVSDRIAPRGTEIRPLTSAWNLVKHKTWAKKASQERCQTARSSRQSGVVLPVLPFSSRRQNLCRVARGCLSKLQQYGLRWICSQHAGLPWTTVVSRKTLNHRCTRIYLAQRSRNQEKQNHR